MFADRFPIPDSPVQEPVKIELRVKPVEGDKLEIADTWTSTFRGMLGEEPLSFSSRGGRRLVVELARVDGGRVTRKNIEVMDAYIENQDVQTGKFIRKDSAIHGRKATVDRKGDAEEHTGLDGVPDHEKRTLGLDDPLAKLFPTSAVAVGDSWEISGEGLKKIFSGGDFTEGRIVVTLRDVRDVDGRRCAFLGTNYDVSGTIDGVKRELRLIGTLTVWIDRGYVLAMTQSGRMKTSGADPKTSQPNGEAAITGELKATVLGKPK